MSGFREPVRPWNVGLRGHAQRKRAPKTLKMPDWWKLLPPGSPNFEKMAQRFSNLIMDQSSLIRKQQRLMQEKLNKGEIPGKDEQVSPAQLTFMVNVLNAANHARHLSIRERQLLEQAARKHSANPMSFDPRNGGLDESGIDDSDLQPPEAAEPEKESA